MSKKPKSTWGGGLNAIVGVRISFIHKDGHETVREPYIFSKRNGQAEHFAMNQTVLGLKYKKDKVKGGKKLLTVLSFLSKRRSE
jgi:hypothetical protein